MRKLSLLSRMRTCGRRRPLSGPISCNATVRWASAASLESASSRSVAARSAAVRSVPVRAANARSVE